MYMHNFKFLAQLVGEGWVGYAIINSKNEKNEKNRPKNHLYGAVVEEGSWKVETPQKVHLGPLLNVRAKFQLSSLIWREYKGETPIFQGQRGGESLSI